MFNPVPWKKNKENGGSLISHKGHPLAHLRDEFDTLFDRFLNRWLAPFGPNLDWEPLWGFDVEDRDQEIVVKAEMPGFDPKEVDVQISGQLLTIKAEKKHETKKKKGEGRYEERSYRSFHRCVNLPPGTNPDKIEATYHNGLLEVHVPKSEEAKGKRIPVKA